MHAPLLKGREQTTSGGDAFSHALGTTRRTGNRFMVFIVYIETRLAFHVSSMNGDNADQGTTCPFVLTEGSSTTFKLQDGNIQDATLTFFSGFLTIQSSFLTTQL